MKIRTAVIPVAGKGTRFLPATKEVPKEMLPILNVPMIDYVVQEAVDAGIERIVFVTSAGKEALVNFYDRNWELEAFLKANGKNKLYELVKKTGSKIEITTVRQKEQLGLGHAINCARDVINDDYFAVLLGDDLIIGDDPVTRQLAEVHRENNGSVIGVMEVPLEDTQNYGIVDGTALEHDSQTFSMKKMVEKPLPAKAPSRLATPGRYILSKDIFSYLDKIPRGAGGEYQLTDAINMMAQEKSVFAHVFKGERYDTGSAKGHLKATLDFALKRDDLREYVLEIMREKVK